MKIVHVKWVYAASLGGWRTKKEVKAFVKGNLSPVDTVGMLIHEDKEKVALIQTNGKNQVIGLFEIPRGCIKSMKTIGKV